MSGSIIQNTGSVITEPTDTTLVGSVVARIEIGSTTGVPAAVTFTGDAAITLANPTVGPGVLIDAAIPGQTTAEQSVLNALGDFVNAGTIAADGPAGSVFTINIDGFFENTGSLGVSSGNTMNIAYGSGLGFAGGGPVQVNAGGTLATDVGEFNGNVVNDGVFLVVGDGTTGSDTVDIAGTLTGAGTIDIGANGILEFDFHPPTQTLQFPTSGAGELILPGPGTYTTPLLGLNTGDKIEVFAGPITGVTVSGSTITIATGSGNTVLTNASFAAGANQSFHSFLDSTTGDWAIQVNAPSDAWGGSVSSDLGTAGNWSAGVPTGADALNFNALGGQILTGTASGLSADFDAFAGQWTLNGATLVLTGNPNPPFDPFALTFDSDVALNGATVVANGTSTFGPGVTVTAQGGSSVTTAGDTIGGNAGQVASLILSGGGTNWTESASPTLAGNGYSAGFLTVGFNGIGLLDVTNSAALNAGNNFIVGQNGDGQATITAGGTLSFGGTFAAVGYQAGSSGRLVIGPGGVMRDSRTALASDNFFSLNIGDRGASGTFGPSTGAVLVNGVGALLDLNGNALSVGNNGGQASLVISNGGTVKAGSPNDANIASLGIGKSGQGDVIVTGTGSALLLAGGMFDGRGGTGNLVVENGGSLNVGVDPLDSSGGLGIGNGSSASNSFVGGSGSATVTGGGRVTITHGLGVGGRGVNGVLNVSNTGSVEVGTSMGVGAGGIVGGTAEAGFGLVNIGAGGTIQIDAIGLPGTIAALFVGDYGGASGAVNVSGAGALLNVSAQGISLGTFNSSDPNSTSGEGSLSVTQGGVATANRLVVGRSGTGELTVNTGGTVAVNMAIAVGEGEVIGPNSEAGFGVVNIGAAGTVTIAGTGLAAGAAALTAGNYAGATGIIKVNGKAAVLNAGTQTVVLGTNTGNPASSGDGLLSVSNGGLVFAGTIVVGDTGTGDFTANIGGALATALDDGAQAGSQGNILLTGPTTGLGLNALTVGDKGLGHVAVTGGANLVVHGTVTVGNAVGAIGYIALATGGHLFAQGLIDGGNGTGALTVDSASVLSITNGLTVGPTGALSLQGGNINAGQIVNNAHIAGAGAISTLAMTNNGVVTAAGGLLAIAGPVTGTGVLAIAPNGALEVRGTGAGQVFSFAAPGGVLQLDNFVATGAGAITNFAPGDQIRIATAGNVSTSFNAATDALSITAAGSTHSFQMTGAHTAADFTSAVVGVDTVLAANQAINLGTGPHFLYLGAASTNDTITAPTPSAGATPNFVDIFNFAATDKLDFTATLASTNWNGNAATVGNYLSVATSGNNAVISLSATSGGAGVAIVTLENSGPKTLAQVLAQATI